MTRVAAQAGFARAVLGLAALAVVGGGAVALWIAKVERIRPLANPFALVVAIAALLAPIAVIGAVRRLRRSAPGPGGVARVAWWAGLLLWLATVFALPDVEGSRVGVAIAAWGGFVAGAIWWGSAAPQPVGGIHKAPLSVSFALVLLEAALRLAAVVVPGPLLAMDDGGEEARLRAFSLRPGEVRFGTACNELGFYDEPFAPRNDRSHRSVAVIGDSFSASFVPHPLHYTTVAEEKLEGVKLWNVGWSAMSPHEYRRVLERDVLPLDPDAVIVSLFLGNDLQEVRPEGGVDRWLRWLFHRDNLLVYQVPRRLLQLSAGGVENAVPASGGEIVGLDAIVKREPWLREPLREPGTFSPDAFLELETRRARVYSAVDPARLEALQGELARMRALVGERPFAVALIPDEAMVDDELWARVEAHAGTSLRRDALRDALLAHCAAEGIPCLDFWPVLRAVGASRGWPSARLSAARYALERSRQRCGRRGARPVRAAPVGLMTGLLMPVFVCLHGLGTTPIVFWLRVASGVGDPDVREGERVGTAEEEIRRQAGGWGDPVR